MNIIGIDPGLSGALAVIDSSGKILHYRRMPVRRVIEDSGKEKRLIDIAQIAAVIARFEPEHAFIEKVHSMPKQGVASTFTFGMGYGMLLGLCFALEGVIATTLVPPQRWQKLLYDDKIKAIDDPKKRAFCRFTELWPELSAENVTHDGIIDALLISEYGRRILNLN